MKSMLKRWTRRKNVTSLGGGNTGTHTFEHAKVCLFTLSRRATGTGECTKAYVFVAHCAFPCTSKYPLVFTRERAFSGTPWGGFPGILPWRSYSRVFYSYRFYRGQSSVDTSIEPMW